MSLDEMGVSGTNGVVDGVDACITADCSDLDGNDVPDFCEPVTCVGDFNGDGVVDAADLGLLVGAWGSCL